MPKFNQSDFARLCRTVDRSDIAEKLGVTTQAVSNRLKNIHNIRLREFLIICELIEEEPEKFFTQGEKK